MSWPIDLYEDKEDYDFCIWSSEILFKANIGSSEINSYLQLDQFIDYLHFFAANIGYTFYNGIWYKWRIK